MTTSTDRNAQELIECLCALVLIQHIRQPTRYSKTAQSLLGAAMTSHNFDNQYLYFPPNIGSSDHCVLILTLDA
ncbi:hypothetical protein GJ496_011690 [Pomphorhynchus laevis]|nr:hypothetical protein GJ496_011690 [Pomphorhynchus laevis]